MPLQVWLQSFCTNDALPATQLTECLKKANITNNLFDPNAITGAGIVVFADTTPEIASFIHTYSRDGRTRILAVAAKGVALTYNTAWQILQAGASDILFWDTTPNLGEVIAARLTRWQAIDEIIESPTVQNALIGNTRTWRSVLTRLVEVACFTDAPVLLMGETGTGKELAARLIHSLDKQRNQQNLVILDCTTIVPELSGSELFGHERGSFTGAVSARTGAFAQADGGTLFLDEVGELPLTLQVQLLRVLQERTYKRVGSNIWQKSDFRLLCATNRDLPIEEEQGQFRRDLYYRLASWTIKLPPLRERIADVLPLFTHFLQQAASTQVAPDVDEQVKHYLLTRGYPGNVRDLKNLAYRIASRHAGPGPITLGDIPSDERPLMAIDKKPEWCDANVEQAIRRAIGAGIKLREIGQTVENAAIRLAVDDEAGNLQLAAGKLGLTDRTLQKWRAKQKDQAINC